MKWIVLSAIIVALIGIAFIFTTRSTNNVCKTFEDYYSDRDKNENCFYNPDHNLTVPQIVVRHGYPLESHTVTTRDGYILTMFRIPHGKNSNDKRIRKPVFIQHGIGANSGCFLVARHKSLAFILADEGYDVWLGNFRGTTYSSNHTRLSVTDSKYWNFSFHEHGIYDLNAQLEYVNNLTKKKISYLGFSMGTTAMYVYATTFPGKASEEVDMFVNLAPAVYLKNAKTILKRALPLWNLAEPILKTVNNGRLHAVPFIPEWLFKLVCFPYPFQIRSCSFFSDLIFGFNYEQNDPETLPVSLNKIPDYYSVKTVTHYIQLISSNDFKNFDYGIDANNNIYGSTQPPFYDLSKLKIPTYFIRSENDLLMTKQDVEKLYNVLPKEVRPYEIYVVKHENFTHLDFIIAKDVIPLLYDHLVDFLKRH